MNKNKELIALRNGRSSVNHGKWTEDELNRLSDMFANGVGISEIALTLSRSERAVNTKASRLGLFRRERAPRAQRDGCGSIPNFV